MTKLEELLNTYTAAYDAWVAADAYAADPANAAYVDANADAADAAWIAAWDAWIAYRAELMKTQEENSDD